VNFFKLLPRKTTEIELSFNNSVFIWFQNKKKLRLSFSQRNSETVRGINRFLASSSSKSWETSASAWSFFSKVRSSHALLSFTNPRNWLWQPVVIVSGNHYVWVYFLVSLVTRQISITSICGQSAILTNNYLCSAPFPICISMNADTPKLVYSYFTTF
jgi:hypothetical protein